MIKLRSLLFPLRSASSFAEVDLVEVEQKLEQIRLDKDLEAKKEEARAEAKRKRQEAASQTFNDLEDECTVCLDIFDNPVMTKCRHLFCKVCIQRVLQARGNRAVCPLCRTPVQRSDLKQPPPPPPPPKPKPTQPAPKGKPFKESVMLSKAGFTKVVFDTKLKKLIQMLQEMKVWCDEERRVLV